MVDPYFFLVGGLDGNRVLGIFPELEERYGWAGGAACMQVVDQIMKRPGEITTKLITEVGTALVMYVPLLPVHLFEQFQDIANCPPPQPSQIIRYCLPKFPTLCWIEPNVRTLLETMILAYLIADEQ